MDNKYLMVMAGGGGLRFWPLSRADFPKQFLKPGTSNAMINETIGRVLSLFSVDRIFIVTGENQKSIMNDILSFEIPGENILYEPMQKNTAPCILYAALHIQKTHGDGIMCVAASDHHISNPAEFLRVLDVAISEAESGKIVTIGIKPTYPATGYGYVRLGDRKASQIYMLDKFVEKPDLYNASRYMDAGEYYWNSGMFVWKVSTIIDLYKKYLPGMYDIFMSEKSINDIYSKLEGISVDYGIMEHVRDALVVTGDFGWSDIGSWEALECIVAPDALGNVVKGNFVGMEATGNIVYSDHKLVTALGVDDLIIVEAGDALLVCAKNRAQDVKALVDILREKGLSQYL